MTMMNVRQVKTFEDLKGLRAECYVRDSTLDQRDGFGPDIQRHNEERFAESYELILGNRWYTEFVSGRSAAKRREFQQLLVDMRAGVVARLFTYRPRKLTDVRAEVDKQTGGDAPRRVIGRNDPCWCGSGKKYKNCHMAKDR